MRQQSSSRDWTQMPRSRFDDYKSTRTRAPAMAPVRLDGGWDESLSLSPVWPVVSERDADLTVNGRLNGEPIGERIIVEGRVTDAAQRPVAGALIEIWQTNSAGRYVHRGDQHPAPIDPNFYGAGRTLTDEQGGYRFITIKPGAYPWGNHRNAWRPAHIHFSVFGAGLAQRLITQMYFQGDPTLRHDPIFNATADAHARNRLIGRFSIEDSVPQWALCYKFDIALAGSAATPLDPARSDG